MRVLSGNPLFSVSSDLYQQENYIPNFWSSTPTSAYHGRTRQEMLKVHFTYRIRSVWGDFEESQFWCSSGVATDVETGRTR